MYRSCELISYYKLYSMEPTTLKSYKCRVLSKGGPVEATSCSCIPTQFIRWSVRVYFVWLTSIVGGKPVKKCPLTSCHYLWALGGGKQRTKKVINMWIFPGFFPSSFNLYIKRQMLGHWAVFIWVIDIILVKWNFSNWQFTCSAS